MHRRVSGVGRYEGLAYWDEGIEMHLGIAQSPRRIKEKNIQVSSHEDSGGNGNEGG